jgi:hypothetical protein
MRGFNMVNKYLQKLNAIFLDFSEVLTEMEEEEQEFLNKFKVIDNKEKFNYQNHTNDEDDKNK